MLGLPFTAAVAAIVEAVKLTGDLPDMAAAARFYKSKHKTVTMKRVGDVVTELLALKKSREASIRYLDDLRSRLERFAAAFPCSIGSVTSSNVEGWLDGLKLSSQSYANNRRVVHVLFENVPPNACDDDVRSFPTFTENLHALRDWLQTCGVTAVAMESTGVYWISTSKGTLLSARNLQGMTTLYRRTRLVASVREQFLCGSSQSADVSDGS